MKISLNRNSAPSFEFKDGRYYYTFSPEEDTPTVSIHSSCLGDTQLKKIQIERNSEMTHWVQPSVDEGNSSGILKDLKEINLKMTDTNSDFWGKIKINARGMLEEYHKDTLSAEFIKHAGGVETRLRNELTGVESRYSQSADGIRQRLSDAEGNYLSLTQIVEGIQSKVSGNDGLESQISQLSGLIEQRVTRNDVDSIIGQSGDAIWLTIKERVNGAARDTTMTGDQIKTAINLSTNGIAISGKQVSINADTYIQNGVIKNAHIGNLDASKITTGELGAAIVRAIQLDTSQITGDLGRFLRLLLDGSHSNVKLDGRDLNIMRNDGTYATRFHENGIELYRGGDQVGSLISLDALENYGFYNNKRSISLTARASSYIGFSYYSDQDQVYYRAFALGGDGRIRFHSPFYHGISNNGFKLGNTRIDGKSASSWRDVVSNGGLLVSNDKDTWLSLSDGKFISMTNLWDTIQNLNKKVTRLESTVKTISRKTSTTYTPPAKVTTPSAPVPQTISVGDTVKLKPGANEAYDHNGRRIGIPRYSAAGIELHAITYRVATERTHLSGRYRLDDQYGFAIFWVNANVLNKV